MNLTPEQKCETQKMDWGTSFGRLVAGVHYHSDNLAGLKLGQTIMRALLPEFLAETFGVSEVVVANKLASTMHDWDDFETSDCYVNNVTPLNTDDGSRRMEDKFNKNWALLHQHLKRRLVLEQQIGGVQHKINSDKVQLGNLKDQLK